MAAIVHHLDAIDAASVGLHALGVDDPAAGAALDPAHRVGQAVVAARAALLLPPWLGLHRPGPGRVAHAFDAIAPRPPLALAPALVLALSTPVSPPVLGPGARSEERRLGTKLFNTFRLCVLQPIYTTKNNNHK